MAESEFVCKVKKIEMIDKNKPENSKVAFVGDGINDAPVLARADIGIAMGGLGSDAAIEAADVVLMTDEPSKLIDAIDIAKATKAIRYAEYRYRTRNKKYFPDTRCNGYRRNVGSRVR